MNSRAPLSGRPTLAVVATRLLDAGALEFLRLCTGLVAGGGALRLVEVGRGRGLFSAGTDLPDEAERQLAGLASFEVRPEPIEAGELRTLLVGCDRLLRVASATRRGTPDVVVIDSAWLLHVPEPGLLLAFEEAGQVVPAVPSVG
jgi:hypothetical protein